MDISASKWHMSGAFDGSHTVELYLDVSEAGWDAIFTWFSLQGIVKMIVIHSGTNFYGIFPSGKRWTLIALRWICENLRKFDFDYKPCIETSINIYDGKIFRQIPLVILLPQKAYPTFVKICVR